MHESDLLGYCLLRPNAADTFLLPLLPGSRSIQDPAYVTPELASNVYGPVNACQNVRQTTFQIRTRIFGWFNAVTLFQMFARRNDGQILGRETSGDFAGSLGPIQWRHALELAVEYRACKVSRFTMAWDGADRPIEVQMDIAAYGFRQNPSTVYSIPRASGRPWSGSGMSHGAFAGVWNGVLSIDNKLTPNLSSPHFASLDSDLHPIDYTSDIYEVSCRLEQASSATTIDPLFSDATTAFILTFTDPTRTRSVSAQLWSNAPAKSETTRGGMGRVVREYRGLKPNLPTPLFRFF